MTNPLKLWICAYLTVNERIYDYNGFYDVTSLETTPSIGGSQVIHNLRNLSLLPPAFQYTSTRNPINAFQPLDHQHINNKH